MRKVLLVPLVAAALSFAAPAFAQSMSDCRSQIDRMGGSPNGEVAARHYRNALDAMKAGNARECLSEIDQASSEMGSSRRYGRSSDRSDRRANDRRSGSSDSAALEDCRSEIQRMGGSPNDERGARHYSAARQYLSEGKGRECLAEADAAFDSMGRSGSSSNRRDRDEDRSGGSSAGSTLNRIIQDLNRR
jgi:hypothetical protein